MCGVRRRRCWAETWDSGDAGGGRRRCWDRFCISDDAVEAYRRQRYRSWSSADAEVRSVSYASNSWPSADAGHSKRRCWAKFWTAADAENAHSGVGLPACGRLAPLRKVYVVWFRQRTGRVGATEGTLWALPVLACRGRAVSFTFSITHRIKPHGPTHQKCEEPVSLTSAYMPAIRLICAVRLAGVSG